MWWALLLTIEGREWGAPLMAGLRGLVARGAREVILYVEADKMNLRCAPTANWAFPSKKTTWCGQSKREIARFTFHEGLLTIS